MMRQNNSITYLLCDWHVHFLCFFSYFKFKCSVSCGTGTQVRKIDCVIPALENGSHADYLNSQNDDGYGDGDVGNANDEKNDHIESLSDAPSNGLIQQSMQIFSNEQISMDCDPKLKPIATQSCTTGIECTTIINNDNIGSSSHEDADRITDASSNENENENENEDMNVNGNENDNTEIDGGDVDNDRIDHEDDNENTNAEADNIDDTEDVNVQPNVETSVEGNPDEDADGNIENASAESIAGVDSEEKADTEETEVFL